MQRQARWAGGEAARLYLVYGALFLGAALGIGVWLRAVYVWPVLKGPFTFQYLVHAHSHVAFFGWVTPALFGVMAAAARPDRVLEARLRVHAHALGALSAAALVAFTLTGYGAVSIAISALHVVLWWAFALLVLGGLRSPGVATSLTLERRFYATALLLLLLAGSATLLPGILMVRGVQNAWLKELGIKLFLTPFIGGWLGLGAMGAVYGRIGGRRFGVWALRLTAAGVVPSALLFVGAPAPWPWLVGIGRAGSLLLGLGGLAFALDALGAWQRTGALLRLAGTAAALKGGLELAAGLGAGGALLHDRSITLAYLHLALLGLVTPALIDVAYGHGRRRAAAQGASARAGTLAGTLAHGLGLALMGGALLGLGWPLAARALAALGLGTGALFPLAFAGGTLSALALAALLLRGPSARAPAVARAPSSDLPAEVS